MEDLVYMFQEFCLSNSDNMCNSVLSTLKKKYGNRLVDFCSKFKDLESIKTNKRNSILKIIRVREFEMESYVSKYYVRVHFYVRY